MPSTLELADDPRLRQTVQRMWLVLAALTMGCAMMLAIGAFVSLGEAWRLGPSYGVVSLVALMMAATAVPLHLLLPRLMLRRQREQQLASGIRAAAGPLDLLPLLLPQKLVPAAILEGAVILGVAALIVDHAVLCWGIAVVLTLLIVAQVPSYSGTAHWISEQWREVEEERLLRR